MIPSGPLWPEALPPRPLSWRLLGHRHVRTLAFGPAQHACLWGLSSAPLVWFQRSAVPVTPLLLLGDLCGLSQVSLPPAWLFLPDTPVYLLFLPLPKKADGLVGRDTATGFSLLPTLCAQTHATARILTHLEWGPAFGQQGEMTAHGRAAKPDEEIRPITSRRAPQPQPGRTREGHMTLRCPAGSALHASGCDACRAPWGLSLSPFLAPAPPDPVHIPAPLTASCSPYPEAPSGHGEQLHLLCAGEAGKGASLEPGAWALTMAWASLPPSFGRTFHVEGTPVSGIRRCGVGSALGH